MINKLDITIHLPIKKILKMILYFYAMQIILKAIIKYKNLNLYFKNLLNKNQMEHINDIFN
jgi:hypothetical protein